MRSPHEESERGRGTLGARLGKWFYCTTSKLTDRTIWLLDTYQVVFALLICLVPVHSCSFTGPLTATATGFSLSTCVQLAGRWVKWKPFFTFIILSILTTLLLSPSILLSTLTTLLLPVSILLSTLTTLLLPVSILLSILTTLLLSPSIILSTLTALPTTILIWIVPPAGSLLLPNPLFSFLKEMSQDGNQALCVYVWVCVESRRENWSYRSTTKFSLAVKGDIHSTL